MKIAYLVSQYPKVSHTFIRREILGLERLGHEVARFSVRRVDEKLADPADLEEEKKTKVILDGGAKGLALGLVRSLIRRPGKLAHAARLSVELGLGSERGLGYHLIYLAEACLLRDWLEAAGAEHVHVHFGENSAMVALLVEALGGPGYSLTIHGPTEFDKPRAISLKEKLEHARFVVGVSSFGKSQLSRQVDWRHWPKIHVVRCGLDAAFLQAPLTPPPAARRLVCVGRLCEEKGHPVLIDAAARLAREGLEFELVLVGDGPIRARLEERISAAGLKDRVRITGWASGEVVRQEITAARALVLPSFAEGLPVVLMEALALGRPVITTYIAGIPELVLDHRAGWLVPAGSVDELVRAMREALQAPPERLAELGAVGRARVQELHDIDKNVAELARLLESRA